MIVVRALLLNAIAGMLFGWLYWRRGLLTAMASHFSADIVLHVIKVVAQKNGALPDVELAPSLRAR